MRILQLVQRPQSRGAEVFAHDLNRQFRATGYDTKTVYLYDSENGPRLPFYEGDVCLEANENDIFEVFPRVDPRLLRRVLAEIRNFRPSIVQVNGARTVKYGALSKFFSGPWASWKLVYRNIGMPSDWHRWKGSVWAYRNIILPQMDGIVGVSRSSLEDARRLYRFHAPSTVILNGIGTERLRTTMNREEFRRRHNVETNAPVLLFVGYLDGVKRPDTFIRVLAEVSRRFPSARGWIVGDGPLANDAQTLARQRGVADQVEFFGTRSDVANFMQAADLLVITSNTEGVPAVVLEAGFLELPVVAMEVGGLPECVRHGETGMLVGADSNGEMVEAISRLLDRPRLRKEMGENASRWVRDNLVIDHVAEQYLEFYRSLEPGTPSTRTSES